MMKSWKNLFIKADETGSDNNDTGSGQLSFPVESPTNAFPSQATAQATQSVTDSTFTEVLQVYEAGLDSINMPGYDFYEFYKTVHSTGQPSEQIYQMAFQMAKTLDNTISVQKLLSDAEFYISKINEVHSQYSTQGEQKLNVIQEKKGSEKKKLQSDIDQATLRISQLRAEMQQLEEDINQKRTVLLKVDDSYYPQERTLREKLSANDMAHKASIQKLNSIKEGIQRFIKI
jgi:hypothetical protein